MKLNRNLLVLALVFVMVFSFSGLLQKQKEVDAAFQINGQTVLFEETNAKTLSYSLLAFPISFNFANTLAERAPLPDNDTRTAIYNYISANPGVQFRAICSGLCLSIGVVQFHLALLQKAGLISAIRKGKYKRFFAAGKFTLKQMETIATLRLSTVKNILKALLEGKHVSHHELAGQLRISSQGLTWQMNRLREAGIIQENRNGLNVTYTIGKTQVSLVTQAMALLELI
jgi:predicted transcriptional regulator